MQNMRLIDPSNGLRTKPSTRYADLVDDVDWQDIYLEHNVMVDARLKANFRAGYWELIFKHTKPLGVIPKDMRAS